jgi:serine/threonine protein kinase
MSTQNLIIEDRYQLHTVVGAGTFAELYAGNDLSYLPGVSVNDESSSKVAIKLLKHGSSEETRGMRTECEVLQTLTEAGLHTVPRFHAHGMVEDGSGREYLVMELLGGEDMSNVRDRCRKALKARLVPLPIACHLARQMLECIKGLHNQGFVHRDIKPANFVRRSDESTEFVMIDFGITRVHRDNKTQELKSPRTYAELRGTTVYASPYAHQGKEQCPRDDLIGLFLAFCDMLCGNLPWSEDAKNKDKQGVLDKKQVNLLDSAHNLLSYVQETASAELAAKRPDLHWEPFSLEAQNLAFQVIEHLIHLGYEDTPDYDLLDRCFKQMARKFIDPAMANRDREVYNVDDLSYNYCDFNWNAGDRSIPKTMKFPSDYEFKEQLVQIRARSLRDSMQLYVKKHFNDQYVSIFMDSADAEVLLNCEKAFTNAEVAENQENGEKEESRKRKFKFPNDMHTTTLQDGTPSIIIVPRAYIDWWMQLVQDIFTLKQHFKAAHADQYHSYNTSKWRLNEQIAIDMIDMYELNNHFMGLYLSGPDGKPPVVQEYRRLEHLQRMCSDFCELVKRSNLYHHLSLNPVPPVVPMDVAKTENVVVP